MALYLRPDNLNDALQALQAKPEGRPLSIVAGGTDFFPARVGRPLDDDVMDISAIASLRGIEDKGDHWRIGATTTWTDILKADLPADFDGLKLAAREVGGVQIQNAGTIAGNLCNASPAADGAPPLLAMDASVELASAAGNRTLPIQDFITGNRQTAREDGEMVVGVTIPKRTPYAVSTFLKLGARKYLVISIVMVALILEAEEGKLSHVRIAVGSCAPVARRLTALEKALLGIEKDSAAGLVTPDLVAPALAPIDDIRGSADYRLDTAVTLVKRALDDAAMKMGGLI